MKSGGFADGNFFSGLVSRAKALCGSAGRTFPLSKCLSAALCAALFSCGMVPKTTVPAMVETVVADTVPPEDYPADGRAVWHLAEGMKAAYIRYDTTAALTAFSRALREDSLYAPAAFETAAVLLASSPDKAEPYSRMAFRSDSANVWYASLFGRIKILREQYDSAIAIYSRLVRERSDEPENYRILAMLYGEKHLPFSAIAVLDSAEMRFGIHDAVSPLKRQFLLATSQYDKALEQSAELIEANPYDIENYLISAELYGYSKRDSLALVNYEKALAIDSTDAEVLASLSEFYNRRSDAYNYLHTLGRLYPLPEVDLKRKIEIFKRLTADHNFYRDNYNQLNKLAMSLITAYPNDFDVMSLYAGHLIASGEMERALDMFKSHVEDSSARIEVFETVLDLESYLEREDSVEKYTLMALDRFPDNAELYLRRGTFYMIGGKYRKAEQAFRDAMRKVEGDSLRGVTLGLIGDVQYQDGRSSAAFRTYERALRLMPDNAMILNNYAYFLSEHDRLLEKALEMSGRAVAVEQNNATYLDTYAWILYKLGRYDEAKKTMRQAISLDRTRSAVLMLHYGDILFKLGEDFMAETYWKKALDEGYDAAEVERRLEQLKTP